MKRRFTIVIWLLSCAAMWTSPALGHGDSVSTLQVRLEPAATRVSLQLNFRDLSQWIPPGTADYPGAVLAAMRRSQAELICLSLDERPFEPNQTLVSIPTAGAVRVDFVYPPAAADGTLEIRTLHVDRLPIGHHQVVSVEDARRGNDGILIAQETLGTEQHSLTIELPTASKPTGRLRLVATPDPGKADAPPRSSLRLLLIVLTSLGIVVALVTAFKRILPSPQRSS
jgi:hypothetical protein